MDIEALRRKKQLNVQQQNALTKHRIREIAERFRNDPESLPWLSMVLANNGLSSLEGILVELSVIPSQGEDVASGRWLTESERFFEFEILLSSQGHALQETSVWREATSEINQSAHNRGTGRSFGCLALEVLHAL